MSLSLTLHSVCTKARALLRAHVMVRSVTPERAALYAWEELMGSETVCCEADGVTARDQCVCAMLSELELCVKAVGCI